MRPLRLEPSLTLGIQAIDEQHGELVDLINQTQALIDAGGEPGELVQVLNRLRELSVEHFSTEEVLMLTHGYADARQHKKLHDLSVERTFDFDAARLVDDPQAPGALLALLREWLLAHIHADRELAEFLKSRGVE